MPRSDDPADVVRPAREVSRRGALRGVAVGGLAVPFVAACAGDESSGDESSGGEGAGGENDTEPSASPGAALAATGDVPVGGGVVFGDEKVVVTQPAEGDFKAFTATCTHAGCVVAEVADGNITCSCHGSMFSAKDGSVVNGPATSPLSAVEITVKGDQITLA